MTAVRAAVATNPNTAHPAQSMMRIVRASSVAGRRHAVTGPEIRPSYCWHPGFRPSDRRLSPHGTSPEGVSPPVCLPAHLPVEPPLLTDLVTLTLLILRQT